MDLKFNMDVLNHSILRINSSINTIRIKHILATNKPYCDFGWMSETVKTLIIWTDRHICLHSVETLWYTPVEYVKWKVRVIFGCEWGTTSVYLRITYVALSLVDLVDFLSFLWDPSTIIYFFPHFCQKYHVKETQKSSKKIRLGLAVCWKNID